MANIARIKEQVDYIKAHPEEWDQRYWHCKTCHCIAGFGHIAAMKNNAKFYFDNLETFGDVLRGARVAAHYYEITETQSDWLFDKNRTIADFDAFIKAKGIPKARKVTA